MTVPAPAGPRFSTGWDLCETPVPTGSHSWSSVNYTRAGGSGRAASGGRCGRARSALEEALERRHGLAAAARCLPRGPLTQRDLDHFADYPLYWLGERFAGYNLTSVDRTNGVFFAYGECKITPCSHPVAVLNESICRDPRPEHLERHPISPRPVDSARGGARLVRYGDGHIQLWTGRTHLSIYAHGDRDQIGRALEELRSAGDPTAQPYHAALLVAERMAEQALADLRSH